MSQGGGSAPVSVRQVRGNPAGSAWYAAVSTARSKAGSCPALWAARRQARASGWVASRGRDCSHRSWPCRHGTSAASGAARLPGRLLGTIVQQCGPDKWQVCVEDMSVAVRKDDSKPTRRTPQRNLYYHSRRACCAGWWRSSAWFSRFSSGSVRRDNAPGGRRGSCRSTAEVETERAQRRQPFSQPGRVRIAATQGHRPFRCFLHLRAPGAGNSGPVDGARYGNSRSRRASATSTTINVRPSSR